MKVWALLLVGLVYLAAGADVDGEATVEEVCTGHMSSFYISVFVYGAPPANLSLNCCHCLFICFRSYTDLPTSPALWTLLRRLTLDWKSKHPIFALSFIPCQTPIHKPPPPSPTSPPSPSPTTPCSQLTVNCTVFQAMDKVSGEERWGWRGNSQV